MNELALSRMVGRTLPFLSVLIPLYLTILMRRSARFRGGRNTSVHLSRITRKLLSDFQPDTEQPLHERLSDREYQIICLIGRGKTVSEIAEALALSVKTVSTHRMHILEKMQMKANAELANYAIKHNLVCMTD